MSDTLLGTFPPGLQCIRVAGLGRGLPRRRARGDGERPRSQLLLKLAGAEIMLILAVNVLAVNSLAVNGALHALYSVKKCLIHSI